MARPKKRSDEKKSERLTMYFTPGEFEMLNTLSASRGIDKTKIISQGLNIFLKTLEDPPDNIKRATYEAIMKKDKEDVRGYVCNNGHPFWIEGTWPNEPRNCPCCGSESIKACWDGFVKKGYRV